MEALKIQHFPEEMEQFPVDPMHLNRVPVSGLFEERARTAAGERPFYTYIPKDLEYDQQCLVIAPPAETEPVEFLRNSGLKSFADEKQVFLFLLKAENGKWDLGGRDAAYMNAVYVAGQARDHYITMQDNFYALGFGSGADVAHQAVMTMSSEWSGLLTVGDLTADLSRIVLRSEEAGLGENGELQIAAEQSQVPVWMGVSRLEGANTGTAAYWRTQNSSREVPLSGEGADYIWMPPYVHTLCDVNEETIAQVRVTEGQENLTTAFLETAWKYIGLARRHRGQGKKNLRYYKDPVSLGGSRHTMVVDGLERVWVEYVPPCCTPDKEWPVVVTMHGRGGTADTFFDISNLYQVANARRFIVVSPQAGVYQQKPKGLRNVLLWDGTLDGKAIDDVKFIRNLLEDLRSRVKVDRHRIYACGQSSGGMMTDTLGQYASDIFAACVAWSGINCPAMEYLHRDPLPYKMPTIVLYGDRDTLFGGADRVPGLPFPVAAAFVPVVEERFRRDGLDKNNVDTWETYPITWYSYPNSQGVPMFVAGVVDNMVHANYPAESWISYDQYMAKFTRGDNGELYYCGKLVE